MIMCFYGVLFSLFVKNDQILINSMWCTEYCTQAL